MLLCEAPGYVFSITSLWLLAGCWKERVLLHISRCSPQQSGSSEEIPDPSVCLRKVKAPDPNHLGSLHLNLLLLIDVCLVLRGLKVGVVF